MRANVNAGVQYTSYGGWRTIEDLSYNKGGDGFKIVDAGTGHATLSVHVMPIIYAEITYLGGPFIGVKAALDTQTKVEELKCFEIALGLRGEASVGAKLGPLTLAGYTIIDERSLGPWTAFKQSYPLASYDTQSCSGDGTWSGDDLDEDETGSSGGNDHGWDSSTGQDSCEYAFDGECDEPTYCHSGTDTSDCGGSGNSGGGSDYENSCEYAFDDECDEPTYCQYGTDTQDCSSFAPGWGDYYYSDSNDWWFGGGSYGDDGGSYGNVGGSYGDDGDDWSRKHLPVKRITRAATARLYGRAHPARPVAPSPKRAARRRSPRGT